MEEEVKNTGQEESTEDKVKALINDEFNKKIEDVIRNIIEHKVKFNKIIINTYCRKIIRPQIKIITCVHHIYDVISANIYRINSYVVDEKDQIIDIKFGNYEFDTIKEYGNKKWKYPTLMLASSFKPIFDYLHKNTKISGTYVDVEIDTSKTNYRFVTRLNYLKNNKIDIILKGKKIDTYLNFEIEPVEENVVEYFKKLYEKQKKEYDNILENIKILNEILCTSDGDISRSGFNSAEDNISRSCYNSKKISKEISKVLDLIEDHYEI